MKRERKKLVALLIVISCFSAYSKEKQKESNNKKYSISVIDKDSHYKVSFSKDKLNYTSNDFSTSITRKNCNNDLFNNFIKKIKINFKKKGVSQSFKAGKLTLKYNNSYKFYLKSSKHGKFFSNIPKKILNISIRNTYKCGK